MKMFPFASLSPHGPLPRQRCNGPSLDDADERVKTLVAEFLDPASLSSLSCTSKAAQLASMQELWLRHCSDKWGVKPTVHQLVHKTPLHTIYPHCHPVPREVQHCQTLQSSVAPDRTVRVKYCGPVGVTNRAVISAVPFPEIPSAWKQSSFLAMIASCFSPQPKEAVPEMPVLVSRPFVTANGEVDVSCYPVAYFEVTIHPLEAASRPAPNFGSGSVPECVAVGLSYKEFNLSRMPGWDELSFGYHSDDGCLFHGKGTHLRAFGPCFGIGDTVGCGIDYRSKEVFYTLNGKLVGVAFSDVTGTLYPTVGIDANVDVELNFGQKPFAFALEHYATKAD